MKIIYDKTVYEASKERLNFLFDEFEEIYVSVSGGKDSTVAFNMTLEIARERRRKIGCFFLDQEFEYASTIEIIRKWMNDPNVIPYWLQCKLKMFNANSALLPYVMIWDEDRRDTWMREKEPNSMHVPFSVSTRFHATMKDFTNWRHEVTGKKICCITGMRAEESMNRYTGTTNGLVYGDITWGRKDNKDGTAITFHPFYDWHYTDVWKYINDNNLDYNSLYDKLYMRGVPATRMRVSNLIHEYTAGKETTILLQEFEAETYERLVRALPGFATTTKFAEDFIPQKLPEVFGSWREYRDYLLNTIVAPEYRDGFLKCWKSQVDSEEIYRLNAIECIKSDVTHTLNNDITKRKNKIIRNNRRGKL